MLQKSECLKQRAAGDTSGQGLRLEEKQKQKSRKLVKEQTRSSPTWAAGRKRNQSGSTRRRAQSCRHPASPSRAHLREKQDHSGKAGARRSSAHSPSPKGLPTPCTVRVQLRPKVEGASLQAFPPARSPPLGEPVLVQCPRPFPPRRGRTGRAPTQGARPRCAVPPGGSESAAGRGGP